MMKIEGILQKEIKY